MSTIPHRRNPLWPYGLRGALLAIPATWLLLLLVLAITERTVGWPPAETRPIVLWIALAISLLPLALHLLDGACARFGGRVGASETAQSHAVAEISRNRANYADMAARTPPPASPPSPAPPDPVAAVMVRFDELLTEADGTTDPERLAALVDESELLAQRRAFLCPAEHIASEAESHLFTLTNWGLSAETIAALRKAAAPALEANPKPPATDPTHDKSRGALHVVFEEYDAWASFIETYNDRMTFWTRIFLIVIGITASAAIFMMFGPSWPWRIGAVVLAAIAGATASVMARLPRLTSYGEWNVNLRSWQARISTGLVGSLVGIGLLGSGLITITLPAPWKSATDLLNTCLDPKDPAPSLDLAMAPPTPAPTTPATPPPATAAGQVAAAAPAECRGGGMVFILAVTMLLGFSERLLTTLETKVVGASTPAPPKP